MESDNSSNSDDSQSNNSSRSASPDNVNGEQSGSGSPSASSHNSAPQSPDNNTSGSQSIDNGIQSPEPDNDEEDDDDLQSPDSSSSKSRSPVVDPCSPEQQQDDEPQSPELQQDDEAQSPEQQQDDEPQSPEQQQDDEPQSPSSASSSSSRVSSTAGSPDRNSNSRPSSKVSSRSNESDKETKEPHDNYLSDVSDEDSMDNINDDNVSQKSGKEWKSDIEETSSPPKEIVIPVNGHNNVDVNNEPNVVNDPEEPLDFEAEDGEDGECDDPKPVKDETEIEEEEEKEPEELEEGEVSDEGEHRPEETEPRPICRFYSRGQCTWGASCRFLHPGVADKGNYSMFEMVRPIPPPGLPPFYPNESYRTHERTLIPGVPIVPIKKDDVPPVETAWERGLRQAKEILKKSNKKKETDIDFEEKKMNLTSNQEEVEKENDYYAQRPTSPIAASPALSPPIERFKPELETRHHRGPLPESYVDEFIPPQVDFYHHRPEFWPPHHARPLPHFPPGHPIDFHAPPRRNPYYPYPPPEPYYHPGLKPHHRGLPPKYPPNREVIMQRSEKSYSPQPSGHRNRRDRSSSRPRRGDDWSDPWMRSKSPGGRSKLRGRKKSYSSHSSFSSSRSSSSSSNSSYSSRSRSRGRSDSINKNRKKAPPTSFKTSPGRKPNRKPERNPSPDAFDKKPMSRSMNPPVPTNNRWSVSPTNPPPSIQPIPRTRQMPMPPRFAVNKPSGTKSPATTHTSSSSSSSESVSGSESTESSDSSGTESSSEGGSPKPKKQGLSPNKLVKKEASKMLKAQMKLNKKKLEAQINPPVKKEKSVSQGKKRSLESDNDDPKSSSPPRKKGGAAQQSSRREELLKQLKAVEDAIARKKSKVAL